MKSSPDRLFADRLVRGGVPVLAALLVLATTPSPALATVERVEATLTTVVQEQLLGAPASVAMDEQDAIVGADELPVGVRAELSSTNLDGVLVALGQGFGRFDDPLEATGSNPAEFGVEAACYSNVSELSYAVRSVATETRRVEFSPSQLPITETGDVLVESVLYISGAVVLWSTDPNVPLDDLLGSVTLKITRNQNDTDLLFTTAIAVAGSGNSAEALTSGPLQSELLSLDDLTAEGIDEATQAVLAQVLESGTLLVVAIPLQAHTYTYEATPSRQFELTAWLEVDARNVPEGTGVAVAVGRPFENLAAFIEEGLPGTDGQTVQRSINQAVAKRAYDGVSATTTSVATYPVCGAFGGELALLLPLACLVALRFAKGRVAA